MSVYAPDGSLNVIFGESGNGVYSSEGKIRMTLAGQNDWGYYAPDGSVLAEITDGTETGVYNPRGNLRIIPSETATAQGLYGPSGAIRATGVSLEFQGMGQNMRTAIQGTNGGANISTTCRTRHYSNESFQRFRVVIPVFRTIGTPLVDTLFTGDQTILTFQVGLEYPFVNAASGLAARIPVTFSGNNYVVYNEGTHNTAFGYLISDIIDVGQVIPAGAFFGIWMTTELPAGVYTNALPYTINATNNQDRWIGQSFSASSRIVANGAGSDFALSSTSITKLGTTQAGVTGIFNPAMLLIEVPHGTVSVGELGDSLGFGNNEGQAGSSTAGDSMGSALGNAGFVSRGVFEVAGVNGFNIAKGSDGHKFWKTADNWKYRRQLLVLGNPTHIINQGGVNDCTQSLTVSGWAATTAYVKYDVRSANSNVYMCETAGTSAGSGGPSGTGTDIVDGTVHWSYIAALPASAVPRGFALIYADVANVHDQIKAALPNVKILKTLVTPNATSSDSWATTANQTAATGWGDATSRRALLNGIFQTATTRLSLTGTINPNIFVEDGTNTSKWVVNGVANYATQDGTHHNSVGAQLAQACITEDFFD